MKKIIWGCLLLPLIGLSQSYNLRITDYEYWRLSGNRKICSDRDAKIIVVFADGERREIYRREAARSHTTAFLLSLNFPKRIIKILFDSFYRANSFSGTCEGDTSGLSVEKNIPATGCVIGGSISASETGGKSRSGISFTYAVTPVVSLVQPNASNNNIAADQPFNARASTGYPSGVYNWEYQLDPNTSEWSAIPGTAGQSTMPKKPQDFLSGNYIGKNIRFRLRLCNGIESNVISYTIIPSSPALLASPTPLSPPCYGGSGSFTLRFNRSLRSSEQLLVSLYRPDRSLIDTEYATRLDANNTYTWRTPRPAGSYLIRYQTRINGLFSRLTPYIPVNITNPPPVIFGATATDISCHGQNNGQINLTAKGGNGNYRYFLNDAVTGVPFSNTTTITGLSAGTHTIRVRDSNGCTEKFANGNDKSIALAITQPDPLALSPPTMVEPTAFGGTNGSITLQISDGTPPYAVTWQNTTNATVASQVINTSGDLSTLNNISAGVYTLSVQDQNGCMSQATHTLTQPPELLVSISEEDAIACNGETGSLTAQASGGVGAYTYQWYQVNGNAQTPLGITTPNSFDLAAGVYKVAVTDANDITKMSANYTLTAPDPLTFTSSPTAINCYLGSDGTIDLTVSGGTPPYTYQWLDGATQEDRSGLPAGTYYVKITDANGCETDNYSTGIPLTAPTSPLNIHYTFASPTFAGATNGWLKATITGGTPHNDGSYDFVWQDASGTDLIAQVTPSITTNAYELTLNNIGAGHYLLTLEDANYAQATDRAGCTITASAYELEDPEPLVATLSVQTPISCHSANTYGDPSNDGVLLCTATGGVPLPPTANDGLPYYYTWKKETSPGVWTVLGDQTTASATGLDAGNYAVNVADANGIIIGVYENNTLVTPTDVTFELSEPPLLELSLTKQDVFCHLGSDGWASATIIGGTPPYTTTWSNGDNTTVTENLVVGTYSVTITDSRGCQVDGAITLTQPAHPIEISYTAFRHPSMAGASDGWVTAQIVGGTPFADGSYTYTWTDANGISLNAQTTTSFEENDGFQIRLQDIPSGVYYLTIEDAHYAAASTPQGCTQVANEYALYDPIEATIAVVTPISCHQNNTFDNPYADGQLQATVKGGLPFTTGAPYVYHWKKQNASGTYEDLPDQTSHLASNLSAGNYALNVEDALGNVIGSYEGATLIAATDVSFTFEEPDLLAVNLSSTAINCMAGNDGTASVSISGGIPPYTIQWSNGGITPTIDNLIAGTYLVYVTDARGCEATGNVLVEQPGGLQISIAQATHPSCSSGDDGAITVSVTGGQPPYTYQWNTGATQTTIVNQPAGSYTVQVTDANQCTAFAEMTLDDPDPIVVDLGEDRTLCQNQAHALDIRIDDAQATYQWTSDRGFSSDSPVVSLTEAGTYTARVMTGAGCVGTDSVVIRTSPELIHAEFLITSQAFASEEVVLVNTSNPRSDTITWLMPDEATIIEQTPENTTLRFDIPGVYEITLRSFQGDCFEDYTKVINVSEASILPDIGDAREPFILDFMTYPNPSTGAFEVAIRLQEAATVSLRLFSLTSNVPLDHRQLHQESAYNIPYDMNMTSGIYFLLLETARGSEIRKIMIR